MYYDQQSDREFYKEFQQKITDFDKKLKEICDKEGITLHKLDMTTYVLGNSVYQVDCDGRRISWKFLGYSS